DDERQQDQRQAPLHLLPGGPVPRVQRVGAALLRDELIVLLAVHVVVVLLAHLAAPLRALGRRLLGGGRGHRHRLLGRRYNRRRGRRRLLVPPLHLALLV